MELYCTKKLQSVEEFGLAPVDTLPSMHVITPEVIVKLDANENMYIADSPNDAVMSNLIKIKKLLCKQVYKDDDTKGKLMDEIIWVKPSPFMYYKKDGNIIPVNKMVLNTPVKLQLSCKNNYIYQVGKPYNVCNMFWSIDYVLVDADFSWESLSA